MKTMTMGTAGLLLCAAAMAAPAADISAPLATAAAAAGAGQHAAAIAALQQALDAVRAEAPLAVEPFTLVSRRAALFGDIAPRTDTTFAGAEELLFYMEPKNLVYAKKAGGIFSPGLEVDLQMIDAEGDVVASKEKFGTFSFDSKSRLQDLYLNLTVTLNGAPAGDYIVRFVLRDANSDKVAQVEQKVTME